MNTAEILRAAARRIRQGWCQHDLADGRGGVCAQGAVMEVMWGDPRHLCGKSSERPDDFRALCDVFTPVHAALGVKKGDGKTRTPAVKNWNNAPDQTAENVAATLEFAAMLWEQDQWHNPDLPMNTDVERTAVSG